MKTHFLLNRSRSMREHHSFGQMKTTFYAIKYGGGINTLQNQKRFVQLSHKYPRLCQKLLSTLPKEAVFDSCRDENTIQQLLGQKSPTRHLVWHAVLNALPTIANDNIRQSITCALAVNLTADLSLAIVDKVKSTYEYLINKEELSAYDKHLLAFACIGMHSIGWEIKYLYKAIEVLVSEPDKSHQLDARDAVILMVESAPITDLVKVADILLELHRRLKFKKEDPEYVVLACFLVRVYQLFKGNNNKTLAIFNALFKDDLTTFIHAGLLRWRVDSACRRNNISTDQVMEVFLNIDGYEKYGIPLIPKISSIEPIPTDQAIVWGNTMNTILHDQDNSLGPLTNKARQQTVFPIPFYLSSYLVLPITGIRTDLLARPMVISSECLGNFSKQKYTYWIGTAEGKTALTIEQTLDLLEQKDISTGMSDPINLLAGLIDTHEEEFPASYFHHYYNRIPIGHDFPFDPFPESTEKNKLKTYVRMFIGKELPLFWRNLIEESSEATFLWLGKGLRKAQDLNKDRLYLTFNALALLSGVPYNILLLDYVQKDADIIPLIRT